TTITLSTCWRVRSIILPIATSSLRAGSMAVMEVRWAPPGSGGWGWSAPAGIYLWCYSIC
ncbi:MAG: hypothetical protein MIO93_03505, partial [ANME-2 cluster archaeon]|nr:hypothetical protein [ANME-2 cluster archaeon]